MYRETGLVNSPPPSAQDDAALLALVQRGDENAMASLFDRYSKIVYSVALRVLRDPASAEDVLQEVFMQIWRNPNGFIATRGSLGGWLAVAGRIEVGTVVAVVSGLGKLNDPWGDLVNWAREWSVDSVKYRLFADAVNGKGLATA